MSKREKDVLASMFLPAAIVMIFTQVTGVVANIIDGVITSRFLGPDAYSAVALLGPMVNIILLLASFISIGGQIVCSHKVGTGERDEANAVFSFSTFSASSLPHCSSCSAFSVRTSCFASVAFPLPNARTCTITCSTICMATSSVSRL